jgi:Glucanosyltransferase
MLGGRFGGVRSAAIRACAGSRAYPNCDHEQIGGPKSSIVSSPRLPSMDGPAEGKVSGWPRARGTPCTRSGGSRPRVVRPLNESRVAQGRSVRAEGVAGPRVDGKFFRVDGERFYVRGVTYGTFAETELGLFPKLKRVEEDFAAMAAVGINTVRTYTVPGPEILDLAEEAKLKLLVGVWWDDPRYLDPTDRGSWQKMASGARSAVKEAVESHAGHPAVLGFILGNEIPGPVVRYHGRRRIEGLLRGLNELCKEAAPRALFGYANYPTTQYLDTGCFDFDCFNLDFGHL